MENGDKSGNNRNRGENRDGDHRPRGPDRDTHRSPRNGNFVPEDPLEITAVLMTIGLMVSDRKNRFCAKVQLSIS